jgi:diadenosine tetraphosphatase ApaH/serine/threonine PP2A family protein phosphatase
VSTQTPSWILRLISGISGLRKYSPDVYEAAVRSFWALPVTALVDGRFFCVHGGISPELNTLADLQRVRTQSLLCSVC